TLTPTLAPASPSIFLPTGELYTLTTIARTGSGKSASSVEGLSVAFATTTSGVSFSPATVVTNSSGVATSDVIIPYGTEVEAVVSGGGMVNVTRGKARTLTLKPSPLK